MIDPSKPTFQLQINGQAPSADITQEIVSFSFEDNEHGMDVLTLTVTNRNNQFTDHPLFTVGNEITARWGYVDKLSPLKKTVIKDLDYSFPENDAPQIRIRAFDKGYQLSGREAQRVWKKPAPGIRYSEIAEQIANAYGMTPVVEETLTQHLRVVQSNQSDAHFLQALAAKARGQQGNGHAGYAFYVQDDELHFHPRRLEQPPALVLEYFTDRQSLLQSIRFQANGQGGKGSGTEVAAIGIDPRRKEATTHKANNQTTPERTSLGQRTYLVDPNSGEIRFREQETGHVVADATKSEGLFTPAAHEASQDVAEGRFKNAELQQVQATARTIGIPDLKAKQNVEVRGIGQRFSGVFYVQSVRHIIADGYRCELTLRKNAVGETASDSAAQASGKPNNPSNPPAPETNTPPRITVDAETGNATPEEGGAL